MIQNLNQLSFKSYGTAMSERQSNQPQQSNSQSLSLELDWKTQTIYRAVSETYIKAGGGMTVLSASLNGEEYESFYLDKQVCIRPGVYYCLSPLRQENTLAEVSAENAPELVAGDAPANTYQVQSSLRVAQIYTFFYHEKERGFFFAGESHPVLELTYVDQGSIHSVADGQDTVLEQGNLVVYGPNQWHMQYADIDVAPRYVTVSFELEGGNLEPLLNRKFRPTQTMITLMQQMMREQERMEQYAVDMIAAQLTQLLLLLLRQQEPALKVKASNSMNSENEIIRRAQQYISTHIREKLSVPYVARMVDVSPSYMTALFHKHLQISPGEYIRRIKIQESKQMIREGNLNFTEIAAALQYSTVHHFSRQFKDKFGITPTEYAKSVR